MLLLCKKVIQKYQVSTCYRAEPPINLKECKLGTPVNPQWEQVLLVFKGHEHKLSNVAAQATKETLELEIDKIDLAVTASEIRYESEVACDDIATSIATSMPIFYKHEGKFIVLTGAATVKNIRDTAKPKKDGTAITVQGRMLSSVALKGIRILKAQPISQEVSTPAQPFNPPRFSDNRSSSYPPSRSNSSNPYNSESRPPRANNPYNSSSPRPAGNGNPYNSESKPTSRYPNASKVGFKKPYG
jgi:hypothetical protein